MGRLSTTSNPTGLHEIDRSRISLSVTEIGGKPMLQVTKIDLASIGLAPDLEVIVVAKAGKTSCRFDLGTVSIPKLQPVPLQELDRSEALRFRVLVKEKGQPRLVASAEGLRPASSQNSESLLPMEPADLGQQIWRLDVPEEGPILKFNSRVFPSAAGAESFLPFAALVLPEAISQVLEWLGEAPEGLDDDSDPRFPWGAWLDSMRIERPPACDSDEFGEWQRRAVAAFCERATFADLLSYQLREASVHD